MQAALNIGMVGHVDHGKTSLTKALTGRWTDTHSEELKRGISIRLGYADATFRKCPNCKGSEAFTSQKTCPSCGTAAKVLRKISIVDAPGHETLMATMLSGAALMHGAILVIAANEPCPQPRTAEHLMALMLSGIEHIVVAQNKVDLVPREQAMQNYQAIKKFLQENGFEKAPIIPTAANIGANIDLLIEAIQEAIPTPEFDTSKPAKMYVARSFDINKPGIIPEQLVGGVVGGSIIEGKIKVGDEIEISPGIEGKKVLTKVSSLSTSNNKLQEAMPGGLIAIGTLIDPSITRNDQLRGQVVGMPGKLPEPVSRLKLELHLIKRLITQELQEIKMNEPVVLTVGTMTTVGTVVSSTKERIDVLLKAKVIAEKGQKIAISKKDAGRWRLAAFGICN
ncbi:MAG: translation initiation factor IF-2 subunit gamma [Candidatus Diapherotrites archaeon]|nr:translation initiation factor IF-2 subunit gamma [Candidatus Diapherotrites archaeon]